MTPVLPTDSFKFEIFDDDELKTLRSFHEQIKEILDSRIVRSGAFRSNIQFDNLNGIITTDFPDKDELRSLVTLVRFCLIQSNSIYYEKIFGILKRHSIGETKSYLKDMAEIFYRSINSDGLMVHINGREYNDKQIFDMWLNGYYFHDDREKNDELRSFENFDFMAKNSLMVMLIAYCKWFTFIDMVIVDHILPFVGNLKAI